MKVMAIIPGEENRPTQMIFARRQMLEIEKLGASVCYYFLTSRNLSLATLQEVKKIYQFIKKEDPDIIHAHYGTITGLLASLFFWKKPVIITFRGSDLNLDPGISFVRRILGICMSQLSILLAKKTLCVGGNLIEKMWWKKKSSTVLTDGVDLEVFQDIEELEAKEKIGYSQQIPMVLINVSKQPITKGLPLARSVIDEINKDQDLVHLKVIEGNIEPHLIPYYINAAHVVLMTSLTEGSPLIIKESLACNTPIVSVDVGDVKDLIKGVDNCYLVSRKPHDIQKNILPLIEARQSSNGREFKERFCSKIKAQELIGIYQKTCVKDRTWEVSS